MRSKLELRHLEEVIMGAAYSVDLRRKVVQACERGTASQAQVARFFGVSQAFVEKLLRLYRRTGALEPDRKRAGRPGLLDAAAGEQVQRWLAEQNDLTLAELAERLQTQCGVTVSMSCVHRLLQRLHMRRKKNRSCQRTGHGGRTTGTPAIPCTTRRAPMPTAEVCR
jgi:transposase